MLCFYSSSLGVIYWSWCRSVEDARWRTHSCVLHRHVSMSAKRRDESRRCTQECVRHVVFMDFGGPQGPWRLASGSGSVTLANLNAGECCHRGSVAVGCGFNANVFEAFHAPQLVDILGDDAGVVWLAHLCRQGDWLPGAEYRDRSDYRSGRNRRIERLFRVSGGRENESKSNCSVHVQLDQCSCCSTVPPEVGGWRLLRVN